MNKEHFQTLLEDLYDKYNHTKKLEVPNIVEKYNGQEFDAIKTFLFKYNFRSHPNFDSKAGSDTYVRTLIESYSNNDRIIKNPKKEISEEERQLDNIKKEIETANNSLAETSEIQKDELLKIANKQLQAIEDLISKKEKYFEDLVQKFDKIIEEKSSLIEDKLDKSGLETLKNFNNEHIELKINLDFEETDIELPKEVHNMASGTRFLITGPGGKLLAFEIKDIFCDYVTVPGKCIKEVNIQRM